MARTVERHQPPFDSVWGPLTGVDPVNLYGSRTLRFGHCSITVDRHSSDLHHRHGNKLGVGIFSE